MTGQEYRVERDSMGEVKVPKSAYYGAQTQRAVENFPISGIGFPPRFIRALAIIKHAAAVVNQELGLLDSKITDVIRAAASCAGYRLRQRGEDCQGSLHHREDRKRGRAGS